MASPLLPGYVPEIRKLQYFIGNVFKMLHSGFPETSQRLPINFETLIFHLKNVETEGDVLASWLAS